MVDTKDLQCIPNICQLLSYVILPAIAVVIFHPQIILYTINSKNIEAATIVGEIHGEFKFFFYILSNVLLTDSYIVANRQWICLTYLC